MVNFRVFIKFYLASERKLTGGTVILNVGGTIHQVKWETIDKFPNSRLQKLRYATSQCKWYSWTIISIYFAFSAEILSLCDSFSLGKREFFFDRSPRVFENILGLYRKGELHLTESVCPRDFLGELEYWGLSSLHLGKIFTFLKLFFPFMFSQNLAVRTPYKEHPGCYQ